MKFQIIFAMLLAFVCSFFVPTMAEAKPYKDQSERYKPSKSVLSSIWSDSNSNDDKPSKKKGKKSSSKKSQGKKSSKSSRSRK